MDVQIIALDIDGTLTDDQKNISNLTLEVLIEAEKKGIRLVLASARPASGLFSIRVQIKTGIRLNMNVGIIRCNVQRSVTWRIGLHFPL